jgi:C4-dicarboxylate-specific signal transduction histidine kinase
VKRLHWISPLLAWGVVVLAAVFIPWGTHLILSVGRTEDELGLKVGWIRKIEEIERYAWRLGCSRLDAVEAAKPGDVETESNLHERYQQQLEAVRTSATSDTIVQEGLSKLALLVARMEDLHARGNEPRTERSEIAPSPAEWLSATNAATTEAQVLEAKLRKDLKRISQALSSDWLQINLMAILSCALAVTLALVLFAYDRSLKDRKQAEEEERLLRAELAHVGRLSVVGEMGTNLAHELNQPLSAIHSYLAGCVRRLQQEGGDHADLIQAMHAAAEEARRASSIIQRMREFVRRSKPLTSTVDLNELVREMLPLLSGELKEQRVQPELRLAKALEPVLADRVQIGQVLVNLIRNSLEAMSHIPTSERKLIIRTSMAADHAVEVAVEDTGGGLSPDVLQNLFQPFHTTKPKGMGMGLAISRTIIDAHGGWIRADPGPGRGAIFHFQIPCLQRVASS